MKGFGVFFAICIFVAAAVAVFDSAKKSFATDGAVPTSAVSTLVNDLGGFARIKLDGSAISRPIGAGETYQVQLGAKGIISFNGEEYHFQTAQRETLLSAVLKTAVKPTPKENVFTAPVPTVKQKTVFVNNTDGIVRVKIGYGSFPVVSGDALEVTQGDTITVSDGTQTKSLEVGNEPIGVAQVFNGSNKAAAYGALCNDTKETVFVSVKGGVLAKPLAAGATRYFASGANATVRFKSGVAKSAGVMHYVLASELIEQPQVVASASAPAVATPMAARVMAPMAKSFAVTKVVNSTGLTVRARQMNGYIANAISDGGVLEFRRGEQIEVGSDTLSSTGITLSAPEVYLMRDGNKIVAVAKVN
jgi:hypothetical protein